MKHSTIFKAIALAGTLSLTSASAFAASVIDNWSFNLSGLNGSTLTNGDSITFASNTTGIDHLNFVGASTVLQTVVGGVALGQSFSDSGYLQLNTASKEIVGPTANLNFGFNSATFNPLYGFLRFDGLTGVLNPDGSITFDPLSGSIALWAQEDTTGSAFEPTSLGANAIQIAVFNILAPSGGSNLDFYGGTAANSTIDITLGLVSSILPDLIKDGSGNTITTLALDLINSDSLLDPNYNPNPDNTGVNALGNGTSVIRVQNNGQFNVTTVPEPTTIALLGLGLLAFGSTRKRSTMAM